MKKVSNTWVKVAGRFFALGILVPLALISLAACSASKFEPFASRDTGPKIYLMTGVNQLENGDFSMEGKHWGDFCSQGGSAEISYSKNQATINVKSPGSENYGVQFYYDGIRSYHDGQYTLSFTASSTVERPCEVRIQLNGGDYHAYAMDTFVFGPEEKRFELTYTMTEDTDASPRLAFNMGKFVDWKGFENWDGKSTVVIKDVEYVLKNEIVEKEKGNGGADFVRVNQIGFRPGDTKFAYAKVTQNGLGFSVLDSSGNEVFSGKLKAAVRDELAEEYVALADFSALKTPGTYTVKVGENQSFAFEISDAPYEAMLESALRFYYLARCGMDIEDETFGHSACHTAEAVTTNRRTHAFVNGGWHDAGDYGRYVVPAAKTVADLLFAYDELGGKNFTAYDILDEVRWELEWLLKMQTEDGGVYHKATCSAFNSFDMPETELNMMFLSPVSWCATADFAGTMALASTYYWEQDPAFAATMLSAAEKAWHYIQNNKFKAFKNESFISTGEYPDSYGMDEKYFAACALVLAYEKSAAATGAATGTATGTSTAAGDAAIKSTVKSIATECASSEEAKNWKQSFGWEQMEGYGNYLVLQHPELFDSSLVKKVKSNVISQANLALNNVKKSGFNQAQQELNWGSNMEAMNLSVLLNLAYTQTGKKAYLEAARSQVDYIMGANPASRCYVTGYGSNSPLHPHHRPSIAKDVAQKGMLVGGPDQMLEDEFAQNLLSEKPPLLCHVDNYQSFSTNEITIYWNSPLILALSLLYY